MTGRRIAVTLAAVVGALVLLAGVTALGVRGAESAYPPEGRFVEVEGTRLHYLDRGTGPAVVLLHGNPGTVHDFAMTVLDSLATDLRVVAFDRPGHGYSERPREPVTPADQARLVHGALEALGVERPVLVGHSWGGALSLLYAERYPDDVAGLVLLGTVAYAGPADADPLYTLVRLPLLGPLFSHTLLLPVGRLIARSGIRDAYHPDTVRADHWAMALSLWLRPHAARAKIHDSRALRTTLAGRDRPWDIRVPVVVVTGDGDRMVDPGRHSYRLAAQLPTSELIALPHAGHQLPHTRPDVVIPAVRGLVHQLGPAPPPAPPRDPGLVIRDSGPPTPAPDP